MRTSEAACAAKVERSTLRPPAIGQRIDAEGGEDGKKRKDREGVLTWPNPAPRGSERSRSLSPPLAAHPV